MKPILYIVTGLIISTILSSCSSDETHVSYSIPELNAEELQYMADTNQLEYTMFCTYSHYNKFCQEEFPKIYKYCASLPIHFCVLFQVRAIDSTYIYASMKEIQEIDSTFNNFVVLSDSLYNVQYRHIEPSSLDKQYRDIEQKGRFGYYTGTIEGNKYINYVNTYIPTQFSHECSTPKLILYKKNEGIIFVNRLECDNSDSGLTYLSSSDKWEIENIIQNNDTES